MNNMDYRVRVKKTIANWNNVRVYIFVIISLCLLVGSTKNPSLKIFTDNASFLAFIAACIAANIAWNNFRELTKEREIKYRSITLEQICLGILNPSGDKYGEEKVNVFTGFSKDGQAVFQPMLPNPCLARFYRRIKNNGFYDGVRAFLGDMMNFPKYSANILLKDSYYDMVWLFFRGASRYDFTWDFLFVEFHSLCKLMGVESGLEEYVNNNNKNDLHTKVFFQRENTEIQLPNMLSWTIFRSNKNCYIPIPTYNVNKMTVDIYKCENSLHVAIMNDEPIDVIRIINPS